MTEHCTEPLRRMEPDPCLMTRLAAAPVMTDLAGAILLDGPREVGGIVVGRPPVADTAADAGGTSRAEMTATPRALGRGAAIAAGR